MTTQNTSLPQNNLPNLSANNGGKKLFTIETLPSPNPLPIPGESNAAYKAAIVLIAEIDRRLERGGHYRIAGRRCTTLDEAVEALLEELKTP